MSIRHLDSMFDPRSVAVVGASGRAGSVGATVWRNLREGGFEGARWALNSRAQSIDGEAVYTDVSSLPEAPELAVICTPPASVPGLIDALGARGTRAAVVLSAGFDATLRQAMLDAARKHLLRIIGPNCLGLLSPHARLNASFAHAGAQPGSLAFVSQSGALVTAVLDWANGRGIGFSHCISLGEHADVDFGDLIDWLATDARTRSILLYVESLSSARKFMSAARAAARNKPVLVVKAGRSAQGQAAAASHTGALAGSDLVYDAAFRRAGMLRVDTLADLFVAAETLAHFRGLPSEVDAEWLERLTLVTNGGGAGVLAADAAALAGVSLAPLSATVQLALDAKLPANWSHANPVDIIGDAPVERYVQTLTTLLAEPASGTLLFMHAPTAIVPSTEIAEALVPVAQAAPGRLLGCWLGDAAVQGARSRFRAAGIPCYDMPEEAVRAFSMLVTYRCNQQLLLQTPPARREQAPFDAAQVRTLVDAVLAEGREMLSEPEAKALLAAAGVPVVGTRVVEPRAEAAVRAALEIGYPVVLKVLSPQISHKSDVGGVALDLENEAALRDAANAMLLRVASLRPDATVTGFTLQTMVRRPQALELIVGASVDPLFGPVILFGQGGTAVEVVADRAIALPPLSVPLARALIERTRVARLLAGWRDVPAADLDAVVATLQAVAELLAVEPRIAEIDINPLLADAKGVIALDARVRVSTAATGGAANFAILPYPAELAEKWDWQGRTLTVRPIRPEDEAQHRAFLSQLEPEDLRMRVFYSRRSIEHSELARLTQIDYGREMAFILTGLTASGTEETLAVVRALSDPDNHDAEFGILVRSDLKGGGLGERLLRKLIDYLRAQGTRRLVATVLSENHRMLQLAKLLGFEFDHESAEPGVRSIHLTLN
ncbi:MAG: bifunctional acetate--CoA ligase family protein/GNAT family N-acetyltransferase [Burkholderiales bacterium]